MEDYKIKEEIKKKKKNEWIEAWFAIEALGINSDAVESALRKHVEKLSNSNAVFVYERKFSEIKKVEKPMKNVEEGYAQVVELKLFLRDIYALINAVLLYGPSSVEILGPNRKEIKIDEMQNIANMLAALIHQFASGGAGGIVITPEK